jgi:gentisate 1,2-dioxygenase
METGMASQEMSGELKARRQEYYDRISQQDMAPLWEVLKNIVPKEPNSVCAPVMWRFDELKALVTEAAGLITAEEAERRVLVLENPKLRGKSRATQSLYAGLQLIMPGEIAGPHRHTAGAIRFILDGNGAYTQVEGEKTVMRPGDFVITPARSAHDHGNTSEVPMIWLDVLDLPTVNFFETGFFEDLGHEPQNTRREHGDSAIRFGSGVLPDGTNIQSNRSPIINYTYERTKPILQKLAHTGDVDPVHGARVRYANPLNGGWVTPTMGAHLALLPKGFKGQDYRSTDGTIYVCAEGRGSTKVGDEAFEWGPRDIFVVPPWKTIAHKAGEDSVLFSISDRPAQESLGIWREERMKQ